MEYGLGKNAYKTSFHERENGILILFLKPTWLRHVGFVVASAEPFSNIELEELRIFGRLWRSIQENMRNLD